MSYHLPKKNFISNEKVFNHFTLFAQDEAIIVNTKRNDDNSVEINFEKNVPGSYYISLNFKSYTNCNTPPTGKVVRGMSGTLVRLRPIDENKSVNCSYSYSYFMGNPNAKPDTTFIYMLPFKKGFNVRCQTLTHLGAKYFNQKEAKNFTAYSFNCESAEVVYSMRKGIVVKVEKDNESDRSKSLSYKSEVNSILIEHEDDTFANYKGFDGDEVYVEPGDMVNPDDQLGRLTHYDRSDRYQLRISVFYREVFEIMPQAKTLKDQTTPYAYIHPYFFTENGNEHLVRGNYYTTQKSEELITKEFSRRELKKWNKKKKDL
ncbi:hypothetical protein [Flammeovirga sp. EKP202]|uniref:hypothetical protein n=1 Tax=Flammeovirga sp. EKP202 TaxID=2770592 RepID=UPI00165F315F|nr:hypothetical protein [Flammeovirga sp. EKP202]MBD0404253.1 hypothetical protein [Flammeovirga sp. EKP202]